MKLALSSDIKKIDNLAIFELGFSEAELVRKSGEAVARAVRGSLCAGARVAVISGAGNNGADGYAAAEMLLGDYSVEVYDLLPEREKSSACSAARNAFVALGGRVFEYTGDEALARKIGEYDCVVDAVFGTGFRGPLPEKIETLARILRESSAFKVAVDLPLGVCADNATVAENALRVDKTVALSYPKPAHYSYPSREFVGEVLLDRIGLPLLEIEKRVALSCEYTDAEWASKNLPLRDENSNKGSFGKLLVITGSEKYKGAALLSLGGALRSGVGLVSHLGDKALISELLPHLPEVVYTDIERDSRGRIDAAGFSELLQRQTAILIGCGSDKTDDTNEMLRYILSTEGAVAVLDADAINLLASDEGRELLKNKKRSVVITPHPLELSRLTGRGVGEINSDRIGAAMSVAREYGITVLLKGARTVITDGERLYINSSGSSALAKGGSGDVLAGVIASLAAQGIEPAVAAALGAYIHGRAGDALAGEYSEYGVLPSDLPLAVAKEIKNILG